MAEPLLIDARRAIRSHATGDLRFDEHVRPISYVVTPDGRLVAPVMVAMIQAAETVLFVPRDEDDAAELLVTLIPFDEEGEHGAAADRWRIYHGEPPDVRWAYLDLDAIRYGESVIDGEALVLRNPLAEREPALCKEMNDAAWGDTLRRIARTEGAELETPRLVGVDADGLHLRGRFGIVRIPFEAPAGDEAEVRQRIEALVACAGDGSP